MLALLKYSTNDRKAFSYDEAFAPDYSEKKSQQILYFYNAYLARKILTTNTLNSV